jgi:hypothetical protein
MASECFSCEILTMVAIGMFLPIVGLVANPALSFALQIVLGMVPGIVVPDDVYVTIPGFFGDRFCGFSMGGVSVHKDMLQIIDGALQTSVGVNLSSFSIRGASIGIQWFPPCIRVETEGIKLAVHTRHAAEDSVETCKNLLEAAKDARLADAAAVRSAIKTKLEVLYKERSKPSGRGDAFRNLRSGIGMKLLQYAVDSAIGAFMKVVEIKVTIPHIISLPLPNPTYHFFCFLLTPYPLPFQSGSQSQFLE